MSKTYHLYDFPANTIVHWEGFGDELIQNAPTTTDRGAVNCSGCLDALDDSVCGAIADVADDMAQLFGKFGAGELAVKLKGASNEVRKLPDRAVELHNKWENSSLRRLEQKLRRRGILHNEPRTILRRGSSS